MLRRRCRPFFVVVCALSLSGLTAVSAFADPPAWTASMSALNWSMPGLLSLGFTHAPVPKLPSIGLTIASA